mmetsp:Transcript_43235/g.50615  ORF Transcript_43235/g.50615 Transcript_43235/m.50615 type:complete len:523 (-) Transcript_43235:114-1682(-)
MHRSSSRTSSQHNSNHSFRGGGGLVRPQQVSVPSQNAHWDNHPQVQVQNPSMMGGISFPTDGGFSNNLRTSRERLNGMGLTLSNSSEYLVNRGGNTRSRMAGHASMGAMDASIYRRVPSNQSVSSRNNGGTLTMGRGDSGGRNESWGNMHSNRMRSGHASMSAMGGGVASNINRVHSGSREPEGGGNASWANTNLSRRGRRIGHGHSSSGAMQGLQGLSLSSKGNIHGRPPSNHDLRKKHSTGSFGGISSGGRAGVNASWGTSSMPQQTQELDDSTRSRNRESSSSSGHSRISARAMLHRPDIKNPTPNLILPSNHTLLANERLRLQNNNNGLNSLQNEHSLRPNLKKQLSAFSFGNYGEGRRMLAMTEASQNERNENWDDPELAERGFDRMVEPSLSMDDDHTDLDGPEAGTIHRSDNPLLVALADQSFREGWNLYMGDSHQRLDKPRGEELIVKAMHEGSVIARGFCLANGWGIDKEMKGAFAIFKSLAVHKGNGYGMALKAHCYLNGNGVARDANEAIY